MAEEGKEIPHKLTADGDSVEKEIMSLPKTAYESQGDCEKKSSQDDEPAVSVLSEVSSSEVKAEEDKEAIPQETADSELSSPDSKTKNSHDEEVEPTIETLNSPSEVHLAKDMAEEGKEIPHKLTADGDSVEKEIMSLPKTTYKSQGDCEKKSSQDDEPAVSVLSEVSSSEVKAEEDKEAIPQETADSELSSPDSKTKNSHDEEVEPTIENGGSGEKKKAVAEESSSPEEDNIQNIESSSLPTTDIQSQGDYIKKSAKKKELEYSGEDRTGLYKTTETAITTNQEERKEGLKTELNEESLSSGGIEDIVNAVNPETEIKTTKQDKRVSPRDDVTTVGAISQEQTVPLVPDVPDGAESSGGGRIYLVAVVGLVFAAIFLQIQPESQPQVSSVQHVEIFRRLMDKVKTQFPHQRDELWSRNQIHLERHLQTAQPTEPVSVILTAGLRAQRTLRCLAQGLASAFSSALNASVLLIDGASVASQDSDQVKLDIDSQLQGAFEGNTQVAVIHRFEELPPGSTLIFYRYCDHENAAYKKTFLIFTVLLEEEEEIPAKIHLRAVEEMVDDHLQKKFLSDDQPVSFDRMDRDKYGGLWSRISHLILPVASEEKIEHEGCERT